MKNVVTRQHKSSAEDARQDSNGRTLWINGRYTDIAMALSWVPFSLLALAIDDNPALLKTLMVAVFLFSFSHQPLTLLLVYGDAERFQLRRALFTWSPLIFCVAVMYAVNFSPLLLAILAGAWNAEHTLMQRYGITRIYGRMAGQQAGGSELPMLFSWLILAVIWAAADPETMERVAALGIQGANRSAFELLTQLRPVAEFLLIPAMAAVLWLVIQWFGQESKRPVNSAKHLYLASTAILFVVMLLHPIAGFVGYVGAHAFEYFIMVNRCLEKGYIEPSRTDSDLGRVVNSALGRPGFFLIYLTAIVLIVFVLESFASFFVYSLVFFTLGALHFFYDGFIWKLRNPKVAQSVGAQI
jgi:hypothetical protein